MHCGLKFELFKTCRHSALTEHTCLQKRSPPQATGTQCLLFKASLANKSQRTPMRAHGCSANRSAPLARSQGQAWRARGTHSPIFSSVEATAMRLMLCRYATSITHICWWPYCLDWERWKDSNIEKVSDQNCRIPSLVTVRKRPIFLNRLVKHATFTTSLPWCLQMVRNTQIRFKKEVCA